MYYKSLSRPLLGFIFPFFLVNCYATNDKFYNGKWWQKIGKNNGEYVPLCYMLLEKARPPARRDFQYFYQKSEVHPGIQTRTECHHSLARATTTIHNLKLYLEIILFVHLNRKLSQLVISWCLKLKSELNGGSLSESYWDEKNKWYKKLPITPIVYEVESNVHFYSTQKAQAW